MRLLRIIRFWWSWRSPYWSIKFIYKVWKGGYMRVQYLISIDDPGQTPGDEHGHPQPEDDNTNTEEENQEMKKDLEEKKGEEKK